MKLLLTGCDGQVGHEVCRQAPSYDISVVATDVADLDITDADAIRSLQSTEGAELFINAAAYTAVDKAESDEPLAYAVNATGAGNLAMVAAEHGIPLLHISTDYIFKGDSTVPYRDDDIPGPTGAYGRTKLAGEQLVAANNPKHVTLRTSWVFGDEGNNFVKTMLRLGSENDAVNVVADQFGSPTYAAHIARALLMLADQYRSSGQLRWGTFNFRDEGVTTWFGFATTIFARAQTLGLLDKPVQVNPIRTDQYPTPATRPAYSAMDCAGFIATYPEIGILSWEVGLERMLNQMKKDQ